MSKRRRMLFTENDGVHWIRLEFCTNTHLPYKFLCDLLPCTQIDVIIAYCVSTIDNFLKTKRRKKKSQDFFQLLLWKGKLYYTIWKKSQLVSVGTKDFDWRFKCATIELNNCQWHVEYVICVAVDFSLICVTSNGVSINFCQVIYAPANVAAILN